MKLNVALWLGVTLTFIGFMQPMGFNAVGSYVYQLSYPSGFIAIVSLIVAAISSAQNNQKLLLIALTVATLCMFYPVYDILQHPLYGRNISGMKVCRILWLNWLPIIGADICFTIQSRFAIVKIRETGENTQ